MYFRIPLMAFSRRILGNEDDAREVVQQVFINLWEKRDKIDLSTSRKSISLPRSITGA